MGSQDAHRYNDPTGEVEQYSLDYLRSLRAADRNEEVSRLYALGHFRDAIAEEAANKAASRTYSNNKGTSGSATRDWAQSKGVNLDDLKPEDFN
ncbi:hypothetical protein ACFVOK_07090 [Streptomyces sp. NPDC057798]|uniref:hypothetical protein n=1 Tax=Streptomyces sp. NPDC057798 TaxID=3346252 RepID=UPI0036CF7105